VVFLEEGVDMAEQKGQESREAPVVRRRRATTPRRTTRGASGPSRRRVGGSDLVDNLNAMIDQLIKENRTLTRQIARLTA
jgi:hypothetical protein